MDLLLFRRRLMMSGREDYIVFADPLVEQICANTWGDGIGLTPSRAARVTSLGTDFRENTGITSFDELVYFSGLTSIYEGAFSGCTNLVSAALPSSVKTVGNRAFSGCTNLTNVSLPQSITAINEGAFGNCTSLSIDINLPNLTYCGRLSFNNTKIKRILSLGKITDIPGSVYNHAAFEGCKSLTDVVLPNTLTNVGPYAFYNCSSISAITWSTALARIESFGFSYAFDPAANINISIPSLTGYFEDSTFTYTGIKKVSNLGSISSMYGGSRGVFANSKNLEEVTLPTTLTSLGNYVFNNCTSLKKVNGLDHIVSINGDYCFCNTVLEGEIHFDSLETLGSWVFSRGSRTNKITKVYLPSITSISGTGTNYSGGLGGLSRLTEVYIGPNITTLGQNTFYGDTALQKIVIEATTPPTATSSPFNGTNSTFKVYVPYSSDHSVLNAYKSASVWSTIASRIYELNANGTVPA
jgi:hypothetical protein